MSEKKLYLIDATAFCYRAFYAIRGLSTSFGQATNAIYGFLRILNKILKEKNPEFIAACFDVSRDTFRQKKFKEYKINRPVMPDDLSSQMPLIKEIISAYGIAIFEKKGYEADDVIAYIAKRAKEKGFSVVIISSDKDILQLVDKQTVVFSPYKDEGTVYDEKKVEERFGVKPKKIVEIIALAGDGVDNIPGVRGIGEKTAAGLLKKFGSLDKVLGNLNKVKPDRLKDALSDNLDKIKLNRELAVLDSDFDLDFEPERLKIGRPDQKELFRLFKRLEFKEFLKDVQAPLEETLNHDLSRLKDKEFNGLFKDGDELILSGNNLDNLLFCAKDKFFSVEKAGANIKEILENSKIKKVGHDLKKIKVSLGKEGVLLNGLYFDTMVAAYLLNPSKSGYALSDLAWDYLQESFALEGSDDLPKLSLIKRLKPKLDSEISEKSLAELFFDIEMPLEEVLSQMELIGIKLDLKLLADLSRDLEKKLAELVEDIYEQSGCRFNINSPKQLGEVLFARLKLPVVKRTKTGSSTDEEVLNKLAGVHKLPAILVEYRQLTKLKNTYVDALPVLVDDKTGRVHTSFNQTSTETGRLSSSNPNLQNIPTKSEIGKNIRKAIIAFESDSYLLSCDYSQIELRVLAHISQDENMISAFKNNADVHKATAALIYGIPEKDVSDEMRDTAKRVNFGIIYGLSAFGLARDLGIAREKAQEFIDAYFVKYPKVKEYMDSQISKAKKDGFVTTILNRRRYLPEINNKNPGISQFAQRQAINTPIQGSSSDLIKLAMIHIHRAIEKNGLETKMILQIHDELLFNIPKKETLEAIALIKEGMENVLRLKVPVRVDIKIGKNWSEMKEV